MAGEQRGRRTAAAALAAAVTSLNSAACYTYRPVMDTAPRPGQYVSVELSDQGRVDVRDVMGSGVARVQGIVRGTDSAHYVIGVESIGLLDGQTSHWAGEQVRIPMADVVATRTRTFSRGRTALAVTAALAALGVFIATRSLLAGGSIGAEPGGPGGNGQ